MRAIHPLEGDVFLGLDLSFDAIRRHGRQLLRWRRGGTRFWFVVYDLLPLQNPKYFSPKVTVRFSWWLLATAKLADGYLCISPHVADDLKTLLAQRFGASTGINVAVFPMGFDIPADSSVQDVRRLPPLSVNGNGFILAVGTVEPRKGYEMLLDAFDWLWSHGSSARLVIVGKGGWKTETLQRRLREHRELGCRLHWLQDLADDGLLVLYDTASALVVPSHGEGFGLPILEARARSCPVLARDIPAFREHPAQALRFFPENADATQLARAISEVLQDSARIRAETSSTKLPSWRDAADTIQRLVLKLQ
ncbi:glycosyltransferase family 1 protein [Sphingomonas sp. 10B4]|uniref:glycosyltransferase family 4 protein n=1 Tax=Sphingomonas sp. 10B4 TaxID=3048575 RepID=UPI002B2342B7|nr:glycosyltransferase family 1 protein [Sphingomonas sp. 10B4]